MEYYELIKSSVISGDTNKVSHYTKEALGLMYSPENILKYGLIEGINEVSQKFIYEDVLIPEVLLSTRALQTGLRILQPYIKNNDKKRKIRIVIGTVYGDVHDIGKNIVKILLSTLDVEIIDLGVDVSADNFVKAVKEKKPDILMMSAVLTTSMTEMNTVINKLKKLNLRDSVSIFIGGGPVRERFRKQIGADYFIEDALELRNYIKKNINKLSKHV